MDIERAAGPVHVCIAPLLANIPSFFAINFQLPYIYTPPLNAKVPSMNSHPSKSSVISSVISSAKIFTGFVISILPISITDMISLIIQDSI